MGCRRAGCAASRRPRRCRGAQVRCARREPRATEAAGTPGGTSAGPRGASRAPSTATPRAGPPSRGRATVRPPPAGRPGRSGWWQPPCVRSPRRAHGPGNRDPGEARSHRPRRRRGSRGRARDPRTCPDPMRAEMRRSSRAQPDLDRADRFELQNADPRSASGRTSMRGARSRGSRRRRRPDGAPPR